MAVALMERLTPAATTNATRSGSRRNDSCHWPKNNRDTNIILGKGSRLRNWMGLTNFKRN